MAIFGLSKFIPVFLGKNCQKKIRLAIFGHSKFIPVFLGKIIGKNSEWPFLAIPNLYQSFWEKLSEKIQNGHFWPFQIYTSLFGKNCQKKFRLAIFGHSKFIPVFLGKIVGKNSEWPFLAIPNLYQFFGKNCHKKFRMAIFGHSKFTLVFWGNCQKKFRMAIFGNSELIPVIWGKIVRKNLEQPFLVILNFF